MNVQKRRVWQHNEIKVLLKSWKNHAYMSPLTKKGCSKNPLYFAISKDLLKDGYNRNYREIMFKMINLARYYRRTKLHGPIEEPLGVKWFNEVEEILKLETNVHKEGQVSESQKEKAMELIYQPYIDGTYSASEPIREVLVRTTVTDDEEDSDSDLLSYSVIEPAESEVPNNSKVIQVSLPQLSSSKLKTTTENILLKFCKEFQRSNRQLEANDAAILELFKEQNEIFRTQTTLMTKLL